MRAVRTAHWRRSLSRFLRNLNSNGRRWALRYRGGLSGVRAGFPEPGPRRWAAGVATRYAAANVGERHRRSRRADAEDGGSRLLQRRRVLPGDGKEMGTRL